jgi:hypothetical protein
VDSGEGPFDTEGLTTGSGSVVTADVLGPSVLVATGTPELSVGTAALPVGAPAEPGGAAGPVLALPEPTIAGFTPTPGSSEPLPHPSEANTESQAKPMNLGALMGRRPYHTSAHPGHAQAARQAGRNKGIESFQSSPRRSAAEQPDLTRF